MCMVVTVRLRALKAKIAAHKKELEELDKNVYVFRPPTPCESGVSLIGI